MLSKRNIPGYLLNYGKAIYNDLFEDFRGKKDSVVIFDKFKNIHKKKKIFRTYSVYGKIPDFDKGHKKSYMFGDSESGLASTSIPLILMPFMKYIKEFDNRFNQIYVNFYADGSEYIESHTDCIKDMVGSAQIGIITLLQKPKDVRPLIFYPRDEGNILEIPLVDGSLLFVDAEKQTKFRHTIEADPDIKSSRISLTFRMIK